MKRNELAASIIVYCIHKGFSWTHSRRGFNFWMDVCDRLFSGDISDLLEGMSSPRKSDALNLAIYLLPFTFTWSESPEGVSYWREVQKELLEELHSVPS